jgi:peptidoglycan-N-acetylglucosamine deacetylase
MRFGGYGGEDDRDPFGIGDDASTGFSARDTAPMSAAPGAPRPHRARRMRLPWRRLAPIQRAGLIGGGLTVVLLVALAFSGLGLQWAGMLGFMAGHPTAAPRLTATPTLEPSPTPTSGPVNVNPLGIKGCPRGAPTPLSYVVRGGKLYGGASSPLPNEVALTFDDGPTPDTSPPIYNVLEQTRTPATFFVMGMYARLYPDLIARERADGFAIASHTWDHPFLTRIPDSQMPHEFGDALVAMHHDLGENACIWLWRPPFGDVNAHVVDVGRAYGLTAITWDVDPQDWSRPGTDVIASRVLDNVHPGAIILLHDGFTHREQTAAALPSIISGLKARKLTPVTLPRLLADLGYPVTPAALSTR